MKLELKGYLIEVGEPKEVGNKGTIIQHCVLHKPARRDEFGDKQGRDDYFQMTAIAFSGQNNSIIDRVDLKAEKGKRVTCTCFLNGKKLEYDEVTYINELRLYDIEIHEAKKPEQKPEEKPEKKNDFENFLDKEDEKRNSPGKESAL